MNKALALKGALCYSCRHEVLRSFVSVAGVSLPRYARLSGLIHKNVSRTRAFSIAPHLLSQEYPAAGIGVNGSSVQETEETEGTGTHGDSNVSQPSQHVPWYLQEDVPSTEPHPVASADQIPALPDNPPPLLPILLEYTFKDLGLDGLKLLDLRGLDQPPALGAHVIMLIGTARSVKHLNVSADRLCRWLRSTWKLSPHADGLLGRNELKIKLRRKARRARIADQAGAIIDEKDDGITTGWICVNAGIVEDPSVQEHPTDKALEGFGSVTKGTRVVVQMFTEDKRAEIDLDGFWEAALRRFERQQSQGISEASSESPPEEVRVPTTVNKASSDHVLGHPSTAPVSKPFDQKRGLHTARLFKNTPHGNSNVGDKRPRFRQPSADDLDLSLAREGLISEFQLSLLQDLSELPDEQAWNELGSGPDDRDTTIFLRLFHRDCSTAEAAAAAQLRLICVAISRQHLGYGKEALYYAFEDYIGAGYRLPGELGYRVLSTMLTGPAVHHLSADNIQRLSDADKEFALRIVDHLSLRGMNVLGWEVFIMLYKAASHMSQTITPDERSKQDAFGMGRGSHQGPSLIPRAMEVLGIPVPAYSSRSLMAHLFRNQDYDAFWKMWRRIPLYGRRSVTDYELLFSLHAELGDSRRARDCLSWVDTMQREMPPIQVKGRLADIVESCRRLAESYAGRDRIPTVLGED